MLRLNKNKNILLSLRDRELNSVTEPYKLSLNVISQYIRSDTTYYKQNWNKESKKPMTYEFGHLYFEDYSLCYSVYGHEGRPSLSHHFIAKNARKKIIDVITYNTPICKTYENCNCELSKCSCASSFILCLTEDNWLCQYNLSTGKLMTEIYVLPTDFKLNFKYCDWDRYGETIVLTSQRNPFKEKFYASESQHLNKDDVVVNIAVFKAFPIEFIALLEIKRSIFGVACKHVNVGDGLLILGINHTRVHIYSFNDVLDEGDLEPFKLGDEYRTNGKIGHYPTGLPLNFNISTAPPLLFDIHCYAQSVAFGGFPYHCIFADPQFQLRFSIKNIAEGLPTSSMTNYVESNVWNDEPDIVSFHPDSSNRIISRELYRVCVYNMVHTDGKLELKKSHCMEFPKCERNETPSVSRFGRRTTRSHFNFFLTERTILATDYEDELDLFGILGVCKGDPTHQGFVKLYDSFNGKEVKTVDLKISLCETGYYTLHLDRELIIIIEKNLKPMQCVYVYNIAECNIDECL